jgi:hypothetical protein
VFWVLCKTTPPRNPAIGCNIRLSPTNGTLHSGPLFNPQRLHWLYRRGALRRYESRGD